MIDGLNADRLLHCITSWDDPAKRLAANSVVTLYSGGKGGKALNLATWALVPWAGTAIKILCNFG